MRPPHQRAEGATEVDGPVMGEAKQRTRANPVVRSWIGAHFPVRTLLAAAGAWLVGLVIRNQFAARAEHIAALAERAELIAAQQEEQARCATLAERLRIARVTVYRIVQESLTNVLRHAGPAAATVELDFALIRR